AFDDVQTNATPINMAHSVCFIQLLDTSNLEKDRTSKFEQWKTVETLIHRIMRMIQTNIRKYVILWGSPQAFRDKGSENSRELLEILGGALK
ncbi:MAG: hypothetical protein KAW09_11330, partial [Thermoplasmata archaeon]|nr:hypothetical protein [Thermoplasmata archaeon]